jgi:hypothetical protein
MKVRFYQLYPRLEYGPDNQETLQALIQAAKKPWEAIDSAVLQNLCATMLHPGSSDYNRGWLVYQILDRIRRGQKAASKD